MISVGIVIKKPKKLLFLKDFSHDKGLSKFIFKYLILEVQILYL